jgi:hypothetical protein
MAFPALNARFLLLQSGRLNGQLRGNLVKARTLVGIIVGLLSWWAVFLLSLALMGFLWPALGKVGRSVQESGNYSALTTGMLALLLGGYVYINGIAGWVTARITGRKSTIWIACAPTVAYAMYEHLYVLWHMLPAWYNLGVVGFIYPFSFLGGLLARPRPQRSPATPGKRVR